MLISPLDDSPSRGRMAGGRIEGGTVNSGDSVTLLPLDHTAKAAVSRVTKLVTFEGLERTDVQSASAGGIVSLAGVEGVEIGLTITGTEHQERLE